MINLNQISRFSRQAVKFQTAVKAVGLAFLPIICFVGSQLSELYQFSKNLKVLRYGPLIGPVLDFVGSLCGLGASVKIFGITIR